MIDRQRKDALFDGFAEIAKALSSGRRAEIIDVLSNGERSVESLSEQVGMSLANTSQHLQTLKAAGLVVVRREGTFVFYRLASSEVAEFWRSLQALGQSRRGDIERLIKEYLGSDDLQELTKDELWDRLRKGSDLIVLDVRPSEEYEAGHIPNAVSIPLKELKKRVRELPKSKEIVAYCRGPVCALAPEAARYLRRKGYKVTRLVDGIPDWEAAGLPLVSGGGTR